MTDDEIIEQARRAMEAAGVAVGCTYRHYKTGNVYFALSYVIRESDLQPMVIYARYWGGEVYGVKWTRPLDDFAAEVEHEGERVRRFEPLS